MINIISGFPKNKVIGKGPDLPWHIPEDLKHFKEITTGKTIIMGLVTYKSIGKALPNRNNIVMSFNKIELNDAEVATSIDEALEIAKKYDKEIFIIGGASIYKLFLPIADQLYISHIKEEYEGDVYFPEYDENNWKIEYEEDKGPFIFKIYRRN